MARPNRRSEALLLAEELLGDIELKRIGAVDVPKKASRLARLLDDSEATTWMQYEIAGYPPELNSAAFGAALRSNREAPPGDDGGKLVSTASIGRLEANAAAALEQIKNPITPAGAGLSYRNSYQQSIEAIERVLGAIYGYVSDRYVELRFGDAVQESFEVVRESVDASVARLVPHALPTLSTAFENASSDDPEQWTNSAAACRRLLTAAADALQPAGPDRNGRKMGAPQYVNRLVAWVEDNTESATRAAFTSADLAHLGARLDAVVKAGNKGAHASVTRAEASRYVVGTYLLLGDLLSLSDPEPGSSS